MKAGLCLSVFVLGLCSLAHSASADAFLDYQKFARTFYNLEETDFERITCNIKSELLSESVTSLRRGLASKRDGLRLVEDISNFSVTVDREGELKFKQPRAEVKISVDSRKANQDTEALKAEAELINKSLTQQIEASSQAVSNVVGELFGPRRGKVEVLSFSSNGKETKFSLKFENGGLSSRFSNNTKLSTSALPDGSITTTSRYNLENNKLLLSEIDGLVERDSKKTYTVIRVEYKQVGSIKFPTKILQRVSLDKDSKEEKQADVWLENCRVE